MTTDRKFYHPPPPSRKSGQPSISERDTFPLAEEGELSTWPPQEPHYQANNLGLRHLWPQAPDWPQTPNWQLWPQPTCQSLQMQLWLQSSKNLSSWLPKSNLVSVNPGTTLVPMNPGSRPESALTDKLGQHPWFWAPGPLQCEICLWP